MTRLTDALERARQQEQADAEHQQTDGPPSTVYSAVAAPPDDEPVVEVNAKSRTNRLIPTAADNLEAEPTSDVARVPFEKIEYRFSPEVAVKLVVGPTPDHTIVEQYRHLCASLHHAQLKNGVRTVMVTSAVEAEGKTTTAANIALTLSHSHQRRVLLIDADLRRPSLHTIFQVLNRDGLGDYLRDFSPTRRKPAVHEISPNLSLLTAGRPTQDPMGGLVSEEMREIIDEAADHFDWVVVDTPPVALLSDANVLAAMIDLAILVVRANSTAYPLVKRAYDAIGPERILGVVLNRARRSDLAVGYGYYYYGYSYKPKDEAPPKRGLARFFGRNT